ncbi:SRPBCC family protein [Telmatospirillum sp. J64-1]|uniref:SRPBCC family protein n=1 Tax=Telmatospirillum sp. J64-1 TaxID=2502183 RepID=UPI00115E3DA8|nr:SRPBCC family protein [Telmatospirillum sp. J64-1]
MERIVANGGCWVACEPLPIFDILCDFEGWRTWWPAELRVRKVEMAAGITGSAVHLGARRRKTVCRVEAMDPPHALTLRRTSGPVRGRMLWRLEPQEGGTLVTLSMDLEITGFLPRLLAGLTNAQAAEQRRVGQMLHGLKRLAETP